MSDIGLQRSCSSCVLSSREDNRKTACTFRIRNMVGIDVSRIRNKKKLLGGSWTEMPSCHQLWKERGQHTSKWLDIKMHSSRADEITGRTEAMHAPTTAGLTK
jgi:hypothetical protein